MKNLAYVLLGAGFLGGAYVTALDVENVDWPWFALAAILAVAGVVLAKRSDRALATSGALLETNRNALRESLDSIVRDLRQMGDGDAIRGAALREHIDHRLRPDLRRFVAARQSMVHLYGLQTYADIMSEFAAGERYINRVWSSSADGYDEEGERYLALAAQQFADARRQLEAAGASDSQPDAASSA